MSEESSENEEYLLRLSLRERGYELEVLEESGKEVLRRIKVDYIDDITRIVSEHLRGNEGFYYFDISKGVLEKIDSGDRESSILEKAAYEAQFLVARNNNLQRKRRRKAKEAAA